MSSVSVRKILLDSWAREAELDRDELNARIDAIAATGVRLVDRPDSSTPWTGLSPLAYSALRHIGLGVTLYRESVTPTALVAAALKTGQTPANILEALQPLAVLGIVLPEANALHAVPILPDANLALRLLSRDYDGDSPWISNITTSHVTKFILNSAFSIAEIVSTLNELRAQGVMTPNFTTPELTGTDKSRILKLLSRDFDGVSPFVEKVTALRLLFAACLWREGPDQIAELADLLANYGVTTPPREILDRWTSEPLPMNWAKVLENLDSSGIDHRMLDTTRVALVTRLHPDAGSPRVLAERLAVLGVGSINAAKVADLVEGLHPVATPPAPLSTGGMLQHPPSLFYTPHTLGTLSLKRSDLLASIAVYGVTALDEATVVKGLVRIPIDPTAAAQAWAAADIDKEFLKALVSLVRLPDRADARPQLNALELAVAADRFGLAISTIEPHLHVIEKLDIDVSEAQALAQAYATRSN